jgi:hypothetical protein
MKFEFFKSNIKNPDLKKVGKQKILIGLILMFLGTLIYFYPVTIEFGEHGGYRLGSKIPGLLIDSLQNITGKTCSALILFLFSGILWISGIKNIRNRNKTKNAS